MSFVGKMTKLYPYIHVCLNIRRSIIICLEDDVERGMNEDMSCDMELL